MSTNTTIGNNNGSYDITDGTGSIVTVGNGNDSIAISGGTDTSITIGSGIDSVTANWGTGNHLTIGSGNDSIVVSGGSGNTITVGSGVDVINASSEASDTVKAGGGNDTISVGADSTVSAGNGVDIITAGGGSAITAGGGNDTVSVGAGSGASITLGSGVDTVTVTGGKATTINVGSGNDTITVSGGSGNTITAGSGNSVITASTEANDKIATSDGTGAAVAVYAGANNTVVVGNGNDTVSLGGSDTVTAGKGIDTFIIGTSGAPSLTAPAQLSLNEEGSIALPITASLSATGFGHDTITGFSTASFDKVAFSTAEFASYAAVMADARQVGANTVITADAADSVTLAGVTLSSLSSSNFEFVSGGSSGGTVLVTLSGIPSGISLSDSSGALTITNGSVTLTTAQLAGLTLKAGGVTTATLTVTATSQRTGTSVSQNIALKVSPVAPVLGGATVATVSEGGTVTLGATDTAAFSDDTLGTVTITGLPNNLTAFSGGIYTASNGTWTGTAAQFNALSFKVGETGTETLAISATTLGATAAATENFTLTVKPASPVLGGATVATVSEGGTVTLGATDTAAFSDDALGTVTITGLPNDLTAFNGGTYTASSGTWTGTAAQFNALSFKAGVTGTATLSISATATGAAAAVTENYTLNVPPAAPTLSAPASLTVSEDGTIALAITETPFSPSDTISITITGVPTDATLSAGTNDGNGSWTLTPGQLSGLTLNAGQATVTTLTVTATNTLGQTASSTDTIALTVNPVLNLTLSTVSDLPMQQGQTLVASTTILGDSADAAAAINYQWQSSGDGGVTWSNVSGALPGAFGNATLSSFLQLTEQNEGEQFRVQASFTDSAGNLITATSAPTLAVTDETPEITVPFSYTVSDLSIVKNGTEIYNNTFSQAPIASSTILTNGVPTPLVFLTLGGTWTESGGQAVMSSAGVAANGVVPGSVYDFALLGTNIDPTSPLGLKQGADFTVSSTFGLTPPPTGDYGMELTDGTATHGVDQLVRMIVTESGGQTVVELVQADLVSNPLTYDVIASQTLTAAQLADNNQIEFQLSHIANTSEVTGTFELIDNGTVTSTTTFANTAPIFTGGVDWTAVDIGAFTSPGVGLNVAAGQSPVEGQTLTASAAANDSDATIKYQWQESSSPSFATFTDIGGNSASYVVKEADIGSFIRVVASTSDPDNAQSATVISPVTGSVLPAAPTLSAPSLVTASNDGSVALPITVTPFNPSDPVSVTITGIPADATLSDSNGPLAVVGGSVTLTPAQLAGLTLTAGLTPATLTITATNNAGATASASETVLLTVNSGSAYLWGSSDFPAQPGSGVHIYAPAVNLNQADTTVGIFYGETSSSYSVNGPDVITDDALMLDPFLLPENGGPQPVETSTISSFPFRYSFVLPSIGSADFNGVAGIAVYETQSGGTRYLNEVSITQATPASPLMVGTPTQIETLSAPEENPVFVSFRTVSSGISAVANYSVAWDQYNPSAGTYTINFQIFNGNGTTSSAVETPLSLSGVGGVATLPAWYFRSGSGPSSLSPYTLAYARLNPVTGDDVVQFQGYGLSGLPSATSFFISPDLSAYAPGATNLINLEENPKTHTLVTSALRFAQFSSATGYELAVAWNEQVTDANGTHDQVEFVEYNLATNSVVSQQTFQLADGLPQNINLSIANDIAVVEYGDNTATNLVEFNASGLQLGTLTVATTQEAQSITNFGDGRVGVVYDNLLDASGTSQLVTDVYDFRISGVNINDSSLNDGINKYVAGTQYKDSFIGENNVSNTYDYIGQNTTGLGPTDVFTGGTGTAWNVAILPDAESNYAITTSDGITTLTNVGDPAHAGSLTLSNVQALAFNPAADPSGNLGSLQATGNWLDIIGPLPGGGEPIAIANGSTLELNTADSATVSFAGPQGTLQLDQASGFTGPVSGFGALNQIDLAAIGFGANTTLGYAPNNTSTGGTLTVTDGTHTASIALLGQYMAASFATASDGHGGTLITDPPVAAPQTLLAQPHA